MNSTNDQRGVTRSASAGYGVFAATLIGLGVMGLVNGAFTPSLAGVPRGLPGRTALAYLCAGILLAGGAGLFWRRSAALAARVLLGFWLLWLVLVRLPEVVLAPGGTGSWWAAGETAVMVAAAWVLYVWVAGERDARRVGFATGARGLRLAAACYGLGLIPFGAAHFTYFERTVSMVPAWLPWHPGWAAFTGAAFIVAGVAMVAGVYGRLAATLSAWEMGLFTLFVWGPVVVKGPPYTASDWSEIVVSWVLTAAAWVVASSYRGVPWLASRTTQEAPPVRVAG